PGGPAAPIRNPPALPDANSHSGPLPRNAPACTVVACTSHRGMWGLVASIPPIVPSTSQFRELGRYGVCTSYLVYRETPPSKVPGFTGTDRWSL
ncbi:hypothetical protein AnigIFM56816_001158, partial [Aspergillus niger]